MIALVLALQAAEFLQKHCVGCHGPRRSEAQVRLDALPPESPLWTRVHERLAAGDMPPEDKARPPEADAKKVLAWIAAEQKARRGSGLRRLNRRELGAAYRDLTGLRVDYAAALPGDGTVDGFDTGADALQDAADSVDLGARVARRVVDVLRFRDPAPDKRLELDLPASKDPRKAFEAWKSEGISSGEKGQGKAGEGLVLDPTWLGENGGLTLHVPRRRGVLRVSLSLAPKKPVDGLPNPRLWVEVAGSVIDHPEIEGPAELVYEIQLDDLPAGPKGIPLSFTPKIEVPYAVEGFENEERSKPEEKVPGGTGLFRPAFDRKQLPRERWPLPFVVLKKIALELDVTVAYGDGEADALLKRWMERAWRRPTGPDERRPFLALFESRKGDGFDAALRAAFQAVLLSAPFRYLAPASDGSHARAARLSFLLTGGPPDAELRRAVDAGRLDVDAQVDRLLGPGFTRPFVTQWLELGQPITLAMDDLRKQDHRFGRHLKASMHEETLAYVHELFAKDRPAAELIRSDWAMMNDILARHYGYEGVSGGRLRPVKLRPDDPRGGGLLGHAGIQSMLCWMGDNWVIYRGAWALRNLLDAAPPPPPLDVPELNPGEHKGKSFREILKIHQENAACATCHKSIDPMGFAFQNFDLSGRWRAVEHERYERKELDGKVEWRGAGAARPVDAAGRLPRGEAFSSFAQCKELMLARYQEDLLRGMLKNLFLYANGRKADVADLAEIRAILKEHAPKGWPLRALLKAVVRSALK